MSLPESELEHLVRLGYYDGFGGRLDRKALYAAIPADPWDACLDVDPWTGQPEHEHGDACPGGCE